MTRVLVALALVLSVAPVGTRERHVPTIDDLMNIKSVGGAQISPDGRRVVYTVSEADFKQDAFVTQIWMADTAAAQPVQLTRGGKSATSPRWSPGWR